MRIDQPAIKNVTRYWSPQRDRSDAHAQAGSKQERVRKIVSALKQCGKTRDLERGKKLHQDAVEARCHTDKYVATALIRLYMKCGSTHHAREVFDNTFQKDVVMWSCLVLGYVENGQSSVALDLFTSMDCEASRVTYVAVIKACACLAIEKKRCLLSKGIAVHQQVKSCGFDSDIVVASTLVDMYGKCGSMQRAQDVFDAMVHKNAVTWTCLISGYVENGKSSIALDLFASIDCEPDSLTFVALIKACASLATAKESEKQFCLTKGIAIHQQAKQRGYDSVAAVANTLVDMYGKCGSMQRAQEVFDWMVHKSAVTWTCLILGYLENRDSAVALDLFTRMECEPDPISCAAAIKACAGLAMERESEKKFCLEKGLSIHRLVKECAFDSNTVVTSSLVDMYRKCGSMQHAQAVFDKMLHKDVVTWTCLISGYVEKGECSVALDLFTSIECEPDSFTYAAALKACGGLAALPFGQLIHVRIVNFGLEQNQVLATALLDMYGKCGRMTTAEQLFISMHLPTIVSWNALVTGYSTLGDSSQVFRLAKRIVEAGVKMDRVTFICILTACSHMGLVEEGKKYFESMAGYGISPALEHYNCMVDLLGRSNRLEEALAIVNNMPFKADRVKWMSLLGACREWNNVEVGKVAFDALGAGDTKDAAVACVLISDIYGRAWVC